MQNSILINKKLFNVSGTSNENKRPLISSTSDNRKLQSNIHECSTECISDKRLKSSFECEIHRCTSKKTDKLLHDAIRKWQLCNFTKCVYDNTINECLKHISTQSVHTFPYRNYDLTSRNLRVENAAVLMAIERKGLRQQDSECNCSLEEKFSSNSQLFSNKLNLFFHPCTSHNFCKNPQPTLHDASEFNVQDVCITSNQISLESNFENNFMTTAVSAAIEQKGLSMHYT